MTCGIIGNNAIQFVCIEPKQALPRIRDVQYPTDVAREEPELSVLFDRAHGASAVGEDNRQI